MSADGNWLCPLHPFGHQWTGKLTCELCGAERSAADAIVSVLGSARGWDSADAERVRDAHRAEVLAENLTAPERTFLIFALGLAADVMASRGDEFTDEDEAALASLRRLAASSPRTAGDEQPETAVEFAVRWPDGQLTPVDDRQHGLRAIEVARRVEPGAALMQRSCTPWTEVQS